MFACGVSFGLYIRVLRRNATAIFRDTEFQLYALMMVIGVVVVTGAILGRGTPMAMVGAPAIAPQDPAFFDTVRNAVFTVVSMQTTTGYCVADFDFWPSLAIAAIFMLGFIGGCAGSTAGGVKVIRALIGARVLMANAESEHRPSVVRPLRIGRNIVDAGTKIEVLSVLLLGLVILLIGATTLYILEGGEADITTAASASLASLCNIGPGLGKVGASETYAWVSAPGQWVLAVLMLLGRLEFFTVIVLLTKRFWVTD
jgi:trk system potassium uptake protein TrkH